MRENGHLFGLHRVIEPAGGLPQAARKLDNSGPLYDNEVVIDVATLNIDSASFHQIKGEVGGDPDKIAERIMGIVAERGKMQNPVTGSGGMLLGTVVEIGPHYDGPVKVGDRVATLVSLTLTPLEIESITKVHLDSDQVDIKGRAYLWPSSPIVALPADLPERLALSALDVCGAPAQTARLVQGARSVLILGAGKSGMLCAAAAREVIGENGSIYGFDLRSDNMLSLHQYGLMDTFRTGDATRPTDVLDAVLDMTGGELVDVVINTCNIANSEMGAILSTRDRGKVYFFNMATDFSKAALGSEGVGKDVDLLIGNGFARGHAQMTLNLVRRHAGVREKLQELLS